MVVDASVALKWVVQEDDSEAATALASRDLAAPSILIAECANVLWTKTRRSELSDGEATERMVALQSAPVALTPIENMVTDALALALRLEHPVYDCLYLALARRLNATLVTADRRFVNAVRRQGAIRLPCLESAFTPASPPASDKAPCIRHPGPAIPHGYPPPRFHLCSSPRCGRHFLWWTNDER